MAAAKITFETRKQAMLRADYAETPDLGQHFITGYTSFADVAPLAAKGVIGGILYHPPQHQGTNRGGAEVGDRQPAGIGAAAPGLRR